MSDKLEDPIVSVRLVSADYYMSSPYPGLDVGFSTYRGLEIKRVPVLRVFGSTSNGSKVCLHVHGVFPYFLIPYDGSAPPDPMARQIASGLDKAINIFQGQGTSTNHHVFKIVLVSGIPVYGFHEKEHQFFKVYFYNPVVRKHSYDLLLNGAVLNKMLQPSEAHIPYVLQFLIDFNLQGMNYVHLKSALCRRKPSGYENMNDVNLEPSSVCELEIDCCAGDILNVLDVQGGIKMNPGLAALWEEERERRRVKGMDVDSVNIPESQVRQLVKPTSSDVHFRGLIKQRLKDYSREVGDISLSFCEVNETLETSLAIETPDEPGVDRLSASYVDFHRPGFDRNVALTSFSEEGEMLDILCELADAHGSLDDNSVSRSTTPTRDSFVVESQHSKTSVLTSETPVLKWTSSPDSVEDTPYDDDSILGSQRSRSSTSRKEHPASSVQMSDSSDEEKETFEMSQIFDSGEDMFGQRSDEDTEGSPVLVSKELPDIPNLDGPNEDDSSDEEQNSSKVTKKNRSYRPLLVRRSSRPHVTLRVEDSRILLPNPNERETRSSSLNSSSFSLDKSDGSLRMRKRTAVCLKTDDSFDDSLYLMGYPSPPLPEKRSSPPRPTTPIRQPQVTIGPLLKDIALFEQQRGAKLLLKSPKVVLIRAEESVIDSILEKDHDSPPHIVETSSKRQRNIGSQSKESTYSDNSIQLEERSSESNVIIDIENISFGNEALESNQPHQSIDVERNLEKLAPLSSVTKEINQTTNNNGSSAVCEEKVESDESTLVDIDTLCEQLEASSDTIIEEHFKPATTPSNEEIDSHSPNSSKSTGDAEASALPASEESARFSFGDDTIEGRNQTNSFVSFKSSTIYVPDNDPPSYSDALFSMDIHGIFPVDNGTPFWGDVSDAGALNKEGRGKDAQISTKLISSLPVFSKLLHETDNNLSEDNLIKITPLHEPPSRDAVKRWLEETLKNKANGDETLSLMTKHKKSGHHHDRSQIEEASMNNSFGFKVSFGNCHEAKAVHQYQYLTILSLELHISTRQDLCPDPEFDAVEAAFFTMTNDVPEDSPKPKLLSGVIAVDRAIEKIERNSKFLCRTGLVDVQTTSVPNELHLISELIQLVKAWDPDIVVGYEIEMLSWGYLLQRASFLGIPIHNCLSRVPSANGDKGFPNQDDIVEGGYIVEKNSDIAVVGRIVLNLWRILRSEIAVQSYTFENLVYHILHRRVPLYSFSKLTSWWNENSHRWLVVEHYTSRAKGNLELLEQLDLIGRTSELARLFGIQFYEVFTRGSQFRVESMMLRLTKPNNFIALSPSVTQRSRMKAPEWLPLILEPESRFYTDPVLVLDFQSLYPSMIIAYNYCYSTCLGRSHLLGKNEPFEFGCTHFLVPPATVKKAVNSDMVNVSPAGVAFVKPEIRLGILPQMLSEILNTRLMVKSSMKEYKNDTTLRRVFDSRQLGLKLIANVTYGYTSANFSGRMPCVELGDSIVSKGRETLERAIHLIESRTDWKARVVYGDTDSVFVLLPGRSREEAFQIGSQIADAVTQMNPKPVKLKFEKVYQPCILQTKKRYVGFKYETLDQTEPVYEAKGIETVRRDGCPAVVKILERSLRVLFSTHDLSQVKTYVRRQFTKILQNRASVQDFIFAKEFRGRQGYKPGACVPALEIAKQKLKVDGRSEPRIGERVPYVVVYGMPGVPLIRLIVPADQFMFDGSLKLNAHYYITRAIVPPLQRCFGLLGIDILSWYTSLPRLLATVTLNVMPSDTGALRKTTISQYFESSSCLLCDEPAGANGICSSCAANKQKSALMLNSLQRLREKDFADLVKLCMFCSGNRGAEQECISMDCPVFYRRMKTSRNFLMAEKLRYILSTF